MTIKSQGGVLVIMGAILSTLTSVSLHYDHSRMALPLEVIVVIVFFFVIIIDIVFLIVIHIAIVFLPIIAIVPIEGPALQRWTLPSGATRRRATVEVTVRTKRASWTTGQGKSSCSAST